MFHLSSRTAGAMGEADTQADQIDTGAESGSADLRTPSPAPDAELSPIDAFMRDTEGDLPITPVGPALRTLREQMGKSLDDISRETRVRREYLDEIERMQLNLTPRHLASGYVGAYAAMLGLDRIETVSRFNHHCGAQREAEPTEIDTTARASRLTETKWLTAFGVGAAAACGVVAIAAVMFGGGNAPEPSLPKTDGPAAPVNAAADALFDEVQIADVDARVGQAFELVARRKAWIEIRGADGTVFRSRTMSAGETYRPRVGAGWTVTTRDAGAFAWRLGALDAGTLGPDNTPVYGASVDAAMQQARAAIEPLTASVNDTTPSR